MRIKLTVEYDGTDFCGWQCQKNGTSVQSVIEKAIFDVSGESVRVTASGRTDAGVHARGQVAHFDSGFSVPPEKWRYAINGKLPQSILILSSERADGFHARFDAKRKTYVYRMYQAESESPIKRRFAARIDKIDCLAEMKKCAEILLGTHDFKCFQASGSSVKDTVRTIFVSQISVCGNDVEYTVCGNGFLYNMVRMMSGALVAAGKGKLSSESLKEMLVSGSRGAYVKTMPPNGLTLESVEYSEK